MEADSTSGSIDIESFLKKKEKKKEIFTFKFTLRYKSLHCPFGSAASGYNLKKNNNNNCLSQSAAVAAAIAAPQFEFD